MRDPIQPPPDTVEALNVWHADVLVRIDGLFARYGVEPISSASLDSAWRELTIRLALEHDPEFRVSIAIDDIDLPSRKMLERVSRSDMMDGIINYEIKRDAQTGEYVETKRNHPLPLLQSAKVLRRSLIKSKSLTRLANEASSMATDYSRNRSLFTRGWPDELLQPYRQHFRTVVGIHYVSAGMRPEELFASLFPNAAVEVYASDSLAKRIAAAAGM